MTKPTLNAWFCCFFCKSKYAPFNCLIKELSAHRNEEKCWLLFRENSGLQNVTFFDEGPSCIRDKGQTTLIDITRMECSNCGEHLGGKIVHVHGRHPIIREGQYVVQLTKKP